MRGVTLFMGKHVSKTSGARGYLETVRRLRFIAVLGLVGVCVGSYAQPPQPGVSPSATPAESGEVPPHPTVDRDCVSCHGPRRVPSVDPDVLAQSVHARLRCTSCHSNAQQLEAVNCGICHPRVRRELASAAHASNPDAANAGGPACIDCHGAHDVAKVDTPAFRNVIAGRCAVCHEERYEGYMDRFHGQAAALGMAETPRCEDCHNAHAPRPASDPESRVAPANLVATCGACHEGANANFVQFDPHPQPHNKAHSALVYYSNLFMELLLAGVFGFFGLHTLLWLQRSLVAQLRHELPPMRFSAKDQYVLRFSVFDRWMHVTVIVSFMLLAMTGLPLMYAESSWAQLLARFLGGEPTMRAIHLVAAAITFGYFFLHVGVVIYRFIKTRDWKLFYGANSLVPQGRDIIDIGRNFAWFLYLGPRPKLGRWTYWEKFDYWAVFWGVALIGASGLMLADPALASRLLPGQALNVAAVVHGEEALLAVGFIFVFHFFHNHLRPENFPMDVTIFTGRLPLARFKEERPQQYERLVAEGQMEKLIVEPPSRSLVIASTTFGLIVVVIGLVLIVSVLATILRG